MFETAAPGVAADSDVRVCNTLIASSSYTVGRGRHPIAVSRRRTLGCGSDSSCRGLGLV